MNELDAARLAARSAIRPPEGDAAHLRQLIERQPGCLVRARLDGVLLACNDAALGLFGVGSLAAVLNTNLTDRLIATERPGWQGFASQVWTNGAASLEGILPGPNGTHRTVLFQGIALKDHPDGIESLLLSLRDTTLTHRLEQSVESQELNRELEEEDQSEARVQLEQALAEREQLAALIEEYRAEQQRLIAALDVHVTDRQRREAEYREKSNELEQRAEKSQLAFLTREREARDRMVALEAQLAASTVEQRRLASVREQQLAQTGQHDLAAQEQNRRALADYELRVQTATAEQGRLLALVAEHEVHRDLFDAAHRAAVADLEQSLAGAREEAVVGEERARQALSELGSQLSQALGEQGRLSALIEEGQRERDRIEAEHRRAIAELQASNDEALAECERVLTGEHERVKYQNEQQDREIADLRQQYAASVAEQQRLSDLVRDRERAGADYGPRIAAIEAEHRRVIAELETSNDEALAECERVLTGEHERVKQQNERQEREIARLREQYAAAVAEQQRLSDLVRERESQQEQAAAEHRRAIAAIEAEHRRVIAELETSSYEALAESERVLTDAHETVKQQNERQAREIADLRERHAAAAAEQQRLSDLVKERESHQEQAAAEHSRAIAAIEAGHRRAIAELETSNDEALVECERVLTGEHERVKQQNERLAREIADLREQRAAAVAEQQRLSDLVRERESQQEQAAAEHSRVIATIDAGHRRAIAELETSNDEALAECERVLTGAHETVKQQNEGQAREIADLKERHAAAAAEQQRLSDLVREREGQQEKAAVERSRAIAAIEAGHRRAIAELETSNYEALAECERVLTGAHERVHQQNERQAREIAELWEQHAASVAEQQRLSDLVREREGEQEQAAAEHGRAIDAIEAEHRRAIAALETSSDEALAERERVLTEEQERLRQQNERQSRQLAELEERHSTAVAQQQRLSNLVRKRESQQERAAADHSRMIAEIEARHDDALAKRAQAWNGELEQVKQQSDRQAREIADLQAGQSEAVAEQRRLSDLLKQAREEREQVEAERATERVEIERRLASAMDQVTARESVSREHIASLQAELALAVSDHARLQTLVAQTESRQNRLIAEYAADRGQAERAIGEAIFKKNSVLKALADQRVELQRWQDAVTELEPLAAAGRLAADVARELQEVLSHVDEKARFVLTLCSADATPRSELQALRADSLRAASLARQFTLSKVRQPDVPVPVETEYVRVSTETRNDLEDS